jgi:site-specific DNA-methyltransferase (adenine-specific)
MSNKNTEGLFCQTDVSGGAFSEVYLEDCVTALKRYADNHFDLAIVDPPYGIGEKFKGGKSGKMNFNEIVNKEWDKIPTYEYFIELFRVSKNQIIWGGNYFDLPPTRGFIIWDKKISEDFTLAMCEYAWTSFDRLAKIYRYSNPKNEKIHPTQKPVSLYDFCIQYSKVEEGAKILDTHLGSGSSRISANKNKLNFVGFEIDEEYFNKQEKRYANFTAQTRLW